MARWFRAVNPDQGCLLPAGIRSWLPPGHLSWQVIAVTGELDLSRFAAAYRADGQGQAPYDPAMMLGLLFYCYFKGIRSSRKIEQACVDDLGCRVICGGAVPSHRAVAEFLRRHRGEVKRLFVQVLALLAAAGAIAGQVAAVDGSPVSGNASRFSNLDGEQLAAKIAALEAAIEAEAGAWLAGERRTTRASSRCRTTMTMTMMTALGGGRRAAAAAGRDGRPAGPAARGAGHAGRAGAGIGAQPASADRPRAAGGAAEAAVMGKYHAAVAAGKCWRSGKIPVPARSEPV